MDETTQRTTSRATTPAVARATALPASADNGDLVARCQARCWISVTLAVFALAGAVLAMAHAVTTTSPDRDGKQDPPATVYLFGLLVYLTLELAMYAYREWRISVLLRDHSWQRSAHETATIGSGKRAQQRLHLLGVDRWFRSTYYLASMTKLKRAEEVDWAGELDRYVVVRVAGTTRMWLYRALKS